MRRIVSVWLPQWPIDRLRRAKRTAPPNSGQNRPQRTSGAQGPRVEPPLALTLSGQGGLRITAVNAAAREHGLEPGLRLADARAILPSLAARPAEPDADAEALRALAEWCSQFSPWTNCDPPDGLWLDSSGSSHLFGGEAALLKQLHRRLAALGIEARLGLAETPGGAWALARYATCKETPNRIAPPGRLRAMLAPLPVEALRLPEESLRLLRRLGLCRVGQLYDLPRAALSRRFSGDNDRAAEETALIQRLDETLGRVRAPLSPLRPAAAYRARANLAEPLTTLDVLGRLLDGLLGELCRALEKDGKGARHLSLTCYRVDGSLARQAIALARPSQEPAHCRRLFDQRLEEIDAGFGIETLVLAADVAEPLAARQFLLDDAISRHQDGDLAQLIDRLSNRLGRASVRQARLRQSHIPERAVDHLAAIAAASEKEPRAGQAENVQADSPDGVSRPFRLLPKPEAVAVTAQIPEGPPLSFTWRHQVHRVARAEGPERIAPEWWLDAPAGELSAQAVQMMTLPRDYYRIEDSEGRRYWLFRAGLYGDSRIAGGPSWYLHGFFA